MREHFEAGTFLPSDLAWHEGAKDWVPLGELLAVTASSDSVEEQKIRVNRGEVEIGLFSHEDAVAYFKAGQLLPMDWGLPDGAQEWKPLHEVLGFPAPELSMVARGPLFLVAFVGVLGFFLNIFLSSSGVLGYGLLLQISACLISGISVGLGIDMAVTGMSRERVHKSVQVDLIAIFFGAFFTFFAQYADACLELNALEDDILAKVLEAEGQKGNFRMSEAEQTKAVNQYIIDNGMEDMLSGVDLERGFFGVGDNVKYMFNRDHFFIFLWPWIGGAVAFVFVYMQFRSRE